MCNYQADDLARLFDICETNGYVKPSVYQGEYNAFYRGPEKEVYPLLRKHNCKIYAYRSAAFKTFEAPDANDNLL